MILSIKKSRKTCLCLSLMASVIASTVIADEPLTTAVKPTTIVNSNSQTVSNVQATQAEAARWGLSTDDYQLYVKTMQTTPAVKWYAQLDPDEVLLNTATNDTDRDRFAELVVKRAYARVSNELAAQHAYDAAWQRLYPNEKPIAVQKNNILDKVALQTGDTLLFFTSLDKTTGFFLVNQLVALIQKHSGVSCAVLVVGNNITDAAIQQWAESARIPLNLVRNHTVILDHDNGRYSQLSHGNPLPFVLLNHQGLFTVVTPSQLT